MVAEVVAIDFVEKPIGDVFDFVLIGDFRWELLRHSLSKNPFWDSVSGPKMPRGIEAEID